MEHTSPPKAKMADGKGPVLPEQMSRKILEGYLGSTCIDLETPWFSGGGCKHGKLVSVAVPMSAAVESPADAAEEA